VKERERKKRILGCGFEDNTSSVVAEEDARVMESL